MYAKRIIPCLDIKNGRVVKGVNFVNLRDAGDPVEVAAAYSEAGADEVVFLDITATHEGRATVAQLAGRVAEQLSIPFTVGGGIRTVEDFREILLQGADKISVNSAAIDRPQLISEAAARYGSQCVVVAIDARRRPDGSGWDVYKHGGRLNTGLDALEWAAKVEQLSLTWQLEEAKKSLYKEIQQAYYNAVNAKTQYQSSQTASEAAEASFRLMKEKYANGKANATEYNEVRTNWMKALSDCIQAKYEYLFRTKILDFYRGIPITLD